MRAQIRLLLARLSQELSGDADAAKAAAAVAAGGAPPPHRTPQQRVENAERFAGVAISLDARTQGKAGMAWLTTAAQLAIDVYKATAENPGEDR